MSQERKEGKALDNNNVLQDVGHLQIETHKVFMFVLTGVNTCRCEFKAAR